MAGLVSDMKGRKQSLASIITVKSLDPCSIWYGVGDQSLMAISYAGSTSEIKSMTQKWCFYRASDFY